MKDLVNKKFSLLLNETIFPREKKKIKHKAPEHRVPTLALQTSFAKEIYWLLVMECLSQNNAVIPQKDDSWQ